MDKRIKLIWSISVLLKNVNKVDNYDKYPATFMKLAWKNAVRK